MNGKKAVLGLGLAAIALIAWLALRGGQGGGGGSAATGAASGSGLAIGSATGSSAGTDDRMQPIHAPIHVASDGVTPDLEGPAEPAPDPATVAIDAAPHPSLADEFAAEQRDASWAREHERELGKRLAALPSDGIALEASECRAHQCRISFEAVDDAAIGRYVAHLEDASGLYGYARMIVLEAITTTPDGKRHERVYARFD